MIIFNISANMPKYAFFIYTHIYMCIYTHTVMGSMGSIPLHLLKTETYEASCFEAPHGAKGMQQTKSPISWWQPVWSEQNNSLSPTGKETGGGRMWDNMIFPSLQAHVGISSSSTLEFPSKMSWILSHKDSVALLQVFNLYFFNIGPTPCAGHKVLLFPNNNKKRK